MEALSGIRVKVNVLTYELPGSCKNLRDAYKITKPWSWAFPSQNYQDTKHLLKDEGHNLAVDAGLARLIQYIIDTSDVGFTHNSVGSGTNTPASTDTDLQTPIQRITVTNRYSSGLDAKFDTFWASADGNGTWNETGLHDAASAGTMLCRRKFGSSFAKSTANTALVAWTITFAAVADV